MIIARPSFSSVGRWLHDRNNATRFWLSKTCVGVSWIAIAVAAISPPNGFGILACWWQAATGIPCPGCGLTRSLSCGLRGHYVESIQHHPMGLLILVIFLFTAVQSILPQSARARIAGLMQAHAPMFNGAYLLFVALFLAFGTLRALLRCAEHFTQ